MRGEFGIADFEDKALPSDAGTSTSIPGRQAVVRSIADRKMCTRPVFGRRIVPSSGDANAAAGTLAAGILAARFRRRWSSGRFERE